MNLVILAKSFFFFFLGTLFYLFWNHFSLFWIIRRVRHWKHQGSYIRHFKKHSFKDFGENMKNLSVSQQVGEMMFTRMLEELRCTFLFQILLLLFNLFSVSTESLYYDGDTFYRCRETFFFFRRFLLECWFTNSWSTTLH